jgi:hypothetical protein
MPYKSGGNMQRAILFSFLSLAYMQSFATAANITPSGVISATPDGANFDYTITLHNSSSSDASIGTFWFAWVPGEDFLATSPLSVTNPTGWTSQITHFPNVPDNGFAIQWTTGSDSSPDNVAPGASLTFMFTSSDTPAQIGADSIFYPGTPVRTSFVYPGAPFSDQGHEFLVSSVPEPATGVLMLIAVPQVFLGTRGRFAGAAQLFRRRPAGTGR